MKRIKLSDLSIRTIFLFSFLSITILSITIFYYITVNSISKNLDKTEYHELQIHSGIIQKDLDSLNASMFSLATDYGVWNEAYLKAKENDKRFFQENYKEWLPANQDADLVLVLDSSERVLTSYGPAPEAMINNRWMEQAIENNLNSPYQSIEESYRYGLVRIDEALYSVGVSPIVNQELLPPYGGVVMIGKQIDEEFIKDLSNRYGYKASIRLANGASFGELPKASIYQYLKSGSQSTKRINSYSLISSPLKDSLNEKVADLIIGSSNSQYSQLYSSVNNYIGIGSFIVIVTIIVLSLLLSEAITSPLRKVENEINRMMKSGRPKQIPDIKATSEIKTVTNAFNSLIETIHSREEDIETKDRFIALISHEFKTPITIINAAIQAMNIVCRNEITPKIASYLNKINRNSLRQLRLVDNLLDITRIKDGQIKITEKSIDIVSHTREIIDSVRIYAKQKNISLGFRSDPDKMILLFDEQKYERILLNLISNAIKFTPPGKSVEVRLSAEHERLKIEVADTGIGLYLVKSFVTLLGGEITLVSEEGLGSSFTVYLPLKIDPSHTEEVKPLKDKVEYAASLEFSDII